MERNPWAKLPIALLFGVPILVIWPVMGFRAIVLDHPLDEMVAGFLLPYFLIALLPSFLLLMFIPELGTRKQRQKLEQEGRSAEARVLAIEGRGSTGGVTEQVELEIEIADRTGVVLSGFAEVPSVLIAQVQPGETIPVFTDDQSFRVDDERLKRVAS